MDKQFDELSKSLAEGVALRGALRKFGIGLACVLLAVLVMAAAPMAQADGYLLVSSLNTNSILRYNETTGAFVDAFVLGKSGGLRDPFGLVFGPDHNLYVSSGIEADNGTGHRDVLRFDGTTGAFLDDFADQNLLTSPRAVLFGPDGNLYVADTLLSNIPVNLGQVVRFNGVTGAFMDYFVPPGSGGLSNQAGMVFGPNGTHDGGFDLYIAVIFQAQILRFDGRTGAFKGVFVSSGSGGLINPAGVVFGPDGNLYVANSNLDGIPGNVLVYQGPGGPSPGAFLGKFVTDGSGGLLQPYGILFGPDGNNDGKRDLYVASASISWKSFGTGLQAAPGTSTVLRYDGTTGAFKSVFVSAGSGGLQNPIFMTFTETNPTTLNYGQ